ncbi:MAG: isoprenyl transferase [Armatimonadia bacterium]|nr:isoprenyl transferase [Armatimonadia bacterium]
MASRGPKVPTHLAIIMDGNGRWARQRLLPRSAGHRKGTSTVRKIAYACSDRGVKVLTLYGFSTENWKRTGDEVGALMGLYERSVRKELGEFHRRGVQFRVIGRIHEFPERVRNILLEHVEATRGNTDLILNLALNYGGRAEIVDGVRSLAQQVREGSLAPDDIDEETLGRQMYTGDLPDPDLLIRTGGDMRFSNFLLWQVAYTELYVTKALWPDFDEAALDQAFQVYGGRERRFGAAGEKLR